MSSNGRSRPPWLHPIDNDLLNAARGLHQDGHAAAAVVTAHAATEVVSEFVIPKFFELRGVPELEAPVRRIVRRFHLSDDRVRHFYEALSGDRIGSTKLWTRFTTHIDRRNGAAHGSANVSLDKAQESIGVCDELVRRLLGVWAAAEPEDDA